MQAVKLKPVSLLCHRMRFFFAFTDSGNTKQLAKDNVKGIPVLKIWICRFHKFLVGDGIV